MNRGNQRIFKRLVIFQCIRPRSLHRSHRVYLLPALPVSRSRMHGQYCASMAGFAVTVRFVIIVREKVFEKLPILSLLSSRPLSTL
jgi:hypothetical protein